MTAEIKQVEPGLYWMDSIKSVIKVVENRSKTRRYAKVLRHDPVTDKWSFAYGPGIIGLLRESDKMTAEQAKAFGGEHKICCECKQELSDPRSIAAGYGPVCASNNGWPWGQEEEK